MKNKKILIIGHVWPEPKSSAAGSRMMQLIECFILKEFQITFATTSTKSSNSVNLQELGILEEKIQLNDSGFNDFVKNLDPAIVMFDRFMTEEQFGWRITESCPDAIKILNTEDLHCLRKGRELALLDELPFDITYLYNEVAKREIASILRCDLSLIISEFEMQLLESDFKIDPSLLHYLPFMLGEITTKRIEKLPSYSDRQHFVTIGNFLHKPNLDSIKLLKTKIWPLIHTELPDVQLHIFGAYASEKVHQFHDPNNGFYIKGFAKNVDSVMQSAKVCLAPLQFGAGLKGKIIDAMKNGTPCAMTTIASEGLFGNLESNGFIENNYSLLAIKAVELYSDEQKWNQKQSNGFRVINDRFIKDSFQQQFMIHLEALAKELPSRRLNNFTGAMLNHHHLQSTKYMSRWIEEKQKTKLNN